MRPRVGIYLVGASSLLIWMGSLAVLDAERPAPGANITTIGDSVWWAFVTVSTVGYGDYFPVTGPGWLVAVGLMLGGVTLVGVITATLASWIIDRIATFGQNGRSRTERSGDGRYSDERSGDGRSDDERSRTERSRTERSRDGRSGDGRSGDGRSGADS
ncbi:MAG: hypothetical protein H7311_06845 [Ramlibacter sp.]|nr:hypothetical protein [Cryobacterium sp.]